MLKFTLAKGKIVLDTNIVLFQELAELYKVKDGEKYLQTIYYMYSRDADNTFRDIDKRMVEENVFMAVFRVQNRAALKMSDKLNTLYDKAAEVFKYYNTTTESRLEATMDSKLDEITTLIEETSPVIEENTTTSGEIKFTTNLTIILNLFSKVETIMKSKGILQREILKQEGAKRIRGGGTTSFREMGVLKKEK
jgi:hypothetical protein